MKEEKRDYNMSDPILTLKCQDTVDSIDRDITEFTAAGYSPAKKTAFEDAIADFDGMPSDNYLKGQMQIKTEAKNVIRANAETLCSTVFTGVENVWGLHSSHYHLFSEDVPMSSLDDAGFLRFLEDFADSTEDNLTGLAGEGIDATTVTAIRDIRVSFNNGLKDQRKAKKARNTGNSDRIKKGNVLYALLVKHANTGKNIWNKVDESKYNDYVIYHKHGGLDVVHINIAPGQIKVLATDLVPGSFVSAYVKKSGLAGSVLQIYYATLSTQAYGGTGYALNDNDARTMLESDPGTVQAYLLVQNTSGVNAGLAYAVIE
jgi:hypothetical protein